MKQRNFEELFLDFTEGTLDEVTRSEFETALAADALLRQSYERYLEVIAHERAVAERGTS